MVMMHGNRLMWRSTMWRWCARPPETCAAWSHPAESAPC